MGRSPRYDETGLKKGTWTPEEDEKLLACIQQHGHQRWRTVPTKAGLQRCGKSCRLRWINYLRPDIKRGKFTLQEENTIIQLHALLGNRWSTIANHLPMRTDNEIKNYWNTHLKKKLTKMGIDPITHRPKNHALGCSQSKDFINLCHTAQWESARLEAEARLGRGGATLSNPAAANSTVAPPPPPPPPPCLDILQVWAGLNLSHNMNYVEMSKMGLAGQNYINCCQDEAEGIMDNSVEYPSGFVGYADLPPTGDSNAVEDCWNVLEDNNNVNYYGSLILPYLMSNTRMNYTSLN